MIGTMYREPKATRVRLEMAVAAERRATSRAGEQLAHRVNIDRALARTRAAQRRRDLSAREDRWDAPGVDRIGSPA